MASHKLPNYLRLYRKRLGLSQREVAFLIGGGDISKPSRYEHFSQMPELRTALALAVIFRVSVSELFLGEYQQIENAVCQQAQRLQDLLATEHPDKQRMRKLAFLKALCGR
jgi:transcriptional regulator with XRE-family HTH domain